MLILDAYNVLGVSMPTVLAGLDERGLCVGLVRSGLASEGDGAVVVCDGGVKPGGPSQSPVHGVELVYSGGGRSADDVIVELVGGHTHPRRVVVVTSDRGLAKIVRRRRVGVMSSTRFIGELARALGQGGVGGVGGVGGEGDAGSVDPGRRLSADEVARWLEEFGV